MLADGLSCLTKGCIARSSLELLSHEGTILLSKGHFAIHTSPKLRNRDESHAFEEIQDKPTKRLE
eukprot:4436891-Amphidinium_carterae.1